MQRKSFAEWAFAAPREVTQRERFLAEMDRVSPWPDLLALIPQPKAHWGSPGAVAGRHAAHLVPAAVLQSVRLGRRRSADRF